MSKNNIAQQYNSMVASIEDAKIYDGRGEYNLYECNKCNNYKVTSVMGTDSMDAKT